MTTSNRCCILVIRAMIFIIIFIVTDYIVARAYGKNTLFHGMVSIFAANKELHVNSTLDGVNISKSDIDNIMISEDYIRTYFAKADEQLDIHWLRLIKHFIPLPLVSGYASHQLVLLATSILTAGGGPVLEMGCGYFSTILLHQLIVVEQKRHLLSTDTDLEWLSKFEKNMSSTLHHFEHIEMTSAWDRMTINRPKWSFVLVDHKPGERRIIDIARLVNMSDVVIMHDTETMPVEKRTGLAYYPYRYRYKYLSTHTGVMSRDNATLIDNIKRLLELTIELKLPK